MYQAQKTVRGSLLVTEQLLRRMVKHLATDRAVDIVICFKGERRISTDNIEDALSDSLVSGTEIEAIRLRTEGGDGAWADITLSNSPEAMQYTLRGDRKWVLALEQDIMNEFNSAKLWFSWLNPSRWPLHNLNIVMPTVCLLLGLMFVAAFHWQEWMMKNIPAYSPVLPMVIASAAMLLQTYFFPSLSFAFGAGLKSYHRRMRTLYFLFGTMGVGSVLSLGQTWLAGWLRIT